MEKNKTSSSKVPLKVFDVPEKSFKMISMDFVGPLPESAGYDTILVVVNKSMKYVMAIPINKEIFLCFGLPKQLISDRGVLFTSNEFRDWCQKMGIHQNLSTTFHL